MRFKWNALTNSRRTLELEFEGISQRTASSGTEHSRNTASDVVHRADEFGIESWNKNETEGKFGGSKQKYGLGLILSFMLKIDK